MPLEYENLVNRRHVREARCRSRTPSVTRRDDYRRRMSNIETDIVAHVVKSFKEAHEVSDAVSQSDFGHGKESGDPPILPRSASVSYSDDKASSIRSAYKYSGTPQEPLRSYDMYGLRSWSYPVWKYLNTTYFESGGLHANTYSPPLMTGDANRAYSGVAPMAAEHSYQLAGSYSPYALHGYGTGYRRYHTRSPEPWHREYSSVGLRHYGSYRPRYVQHTVRPVWASYY